MSPSLQLPYISPNVVKNKLAVDMTHISNLDKLLRTPSNIGEGKVNGWGKGGRKTAYYLKQHNVTHNWLRKGFTRKPVSAHSSHSKLSATCAAPLLTACTTTRTIATLPPELSSKSSESLTLLAVFPSFGGQFVHTASPSSEFPGSKVLFLFSFLAEICLTRLSWGLCPFLLLGPSGSAKLISLRKNVEESFCIICSQSLAHKIHETFRI